MCVLVEYILPEMNNQEVASSKFSMEESFISSALLKPGSNRSHINTEVYGITDWEWCKTASSEVIFPIVSEGRVTVNVVFFPY